MQQSFPDFPVSSDTFNDLKDFIKCYNAQNRFERQESERFKVFTYDDIMKRDKVNPQISPLLKSSPEKSPITLNRHWSSFPLFTRIWGTVNRRGGPPCPPANSRWTISCDLPLQTPEWVWIPCPRTGWTLGFTRLGFTVQGGALRNHLILSLFVIWICPDSLRSYGMPYDDRNRHLGFRF